MANGGSIIREAVIGAATAPNYNHEFKAGIYTNKSFIGDQI
jgi:hypothetical protein